MAKLIHAFSHKTGTKNVGFFMPFIRDYPVFLSGACIRCMIPLSFFIPVFVSHRQFWRGSGLLMLMLMH
ncbi:hypothetical protein ASU91_20680 [Enterobacter hormaechei subsp. steigerwaltii]|nr:hypothetical protein [Enterobacter hormaechei]KJX37553.1 hypothetical protein SG79_23945 [Enterobacter hormaechei subsp. xiangfangensis]KJL75489.1 hypothetical protein SS35_13070 [Enterobacter hormaechei subsp. steigerwaltii]KJL78474.1 hypothetical protein SS24_23260 [Enterobacter hormaechei subsp. steigerwaltii]KJL79598.1 hypothetical protein SS61_23130 [Enterobacter hormaechei subsp. steigerwaltii]KJW82152.1 hypothetical protein SG68_15970 [Enterobacter hormaechei subsp. steigerwaltii]